MATDARELAARRVRAVEARSTKFRRELGLVDLVLIQVLYVVGSGWVGTAAKLGPSHIVFWILAAALFYLPQAAIVIYLNRQMPLEGGLYQWVAAGFGERAGFFVAWNLWAYTILVMATFGVIVATNVSYLLGPGAAWLTGARWYTAGLGVAVVCGIMLVSVRGLSAGKWLQNAGGAAQFLTFGALIIVPFVAVRRGALAAYHPLATAAPSFTLLTLNILGKLALGAFSGFEYVAILAGECRNPARSIGRSVVVAVPLIALMFIFGTSSVLALVPAHDIDLVSPIPQALTLGFRGLGVAAYVVPALILLLLVRQVGSMTYIFAGNTRLPMVAGWDGLLPAWFTRLHPRFRTPTNSILFVGVITAALTAAANAGVGVQEAFQLLDNAAGIFYAFAYLAMFALPLAAARRLAEPPPRWLRVAAVAGFGMTLLYTVLAIFPIVDVASWWVFGGKIVAVLVAANLIGAAVYVAGRRRALVAA
ncbi:MAG TPA: APC family permease [Gemmatimonadales bacterium]|nr:APC family permease [Gemmatimonadales bacterium]